MKRRIIESNKYKRYNLYLTQFSAIYTILTLIFLVFGITETINGDSIKQTWTVIGIVIAFWSAFFLPFNFYYGIKMMLMRKNYNIYKSYAGTITSIHTSELFRTDHRNIDIKVDDIGKTLKTKIYKGRLYDDVIVLKVLQ